MCHKFGPQANPVKYSIPNEGRKADDFGIISAAKKHNSTNIVVWMKPGRMGDLSVFCLRLPALLRGDALADSDGELGFHFELRFAKLETRAANVAARVERQ